MTLRCPTFRSKQAEYGLGPDNELRFLFQPPSGGFVGHRDVPSGEQIGGICAQPRAGSPALEFPSGRADSSSTLLALAFESCPCPNIATSRARQQPAVRPGGCCH